jgi:hypothetical protein
MGIHSYDADRTGVVCSVDGKSEREEFIHAKDRFVEQHVSYLTLWQGALCSMQTERPVQWRSRRKPTRRNIVVLVRFALRTLESSLFVQPAQLRQYLHQADSRRSFRYSYIDTSRFGTMGKETSCPGSELLRLLLSLAITGHRP